VSEAPTFDFSTQCCFCGADNTDGCIGYAGERTCSTCGFGGNGEPDKPRMAYHGKVHIHSRASKGWLAKLGEKDVSESAPPSQNEKGDQ